VCGVSECDGEASKMRMPSSIGAVPPWGKKIVTEGEEGQDLALV
jgi:hypothetical protein